MTFLAHWLVHPLHGVIGEIMTALLVAFGIPFMLLVVVVMGMKWYEGEFDREVEKIQPQPDMGSYGAPRTKDERTARRIKIAEEPEIFEEIQVDKRFKTTEHAPFEWEVKHAPHE